MCVYTCARVCVCTRVCVCVCVLSGGEMHSYGHEEFKNVNPFSVQRAHQDLRAGQYLRPNAAPYSSFNGNSRTFATLPISVQTLH